MANAYLKTLEEIYGGVSNIPQDVLEKAQKKEKSQLAEQKNNTELSQGLRSFFGLETMAEKVEKENKKIAECTDNLKKAGVDDNAKIYSECEFPNRSAETLKYRVDEEIKKWADWDNDEKWQEENARNEKNKILETLSDKYGINKNDSNVEKQEIAMNEIKNDNFHRMR